MPHLIKRLLPTAAVSCAIALSLSACASQSPAQSVATQVKQANALIKLVPAANRDGAVVSTPGTYFGCDATTRQYITGLVQDLKGLAPQPFIEGLKAKLEAQGYKTSWYTASNPRKLVADKDGFEFWFGSITDKRDAKSSKQAINLTSFGKCFSTGK